MERRKAERLALKEKLELEQLDERGLGTARFVDVDMTNISKSGIGFETTEQLTLHDIFDGKIEIWTDENIRVVIEIIRMESDGELFRYGGEFIGMSETDALKIELHQMFEE